MTAASWHLVWPCSRRRRPRVCRRGLAHDPELMLRMLIVGYCYGIRSERCLCEEVQPARTTSEKRSWGSWVDT